jgi:hypothetical protein
MEGPANPAVRGMDAVELAATPRPWLARLQRRLPLGMAATDIDAGWLPAGHSGGPRPPAGGGG